MDKLGFLMQEEERGGIDFGVKLPHISIKAEPLFDLGFMIFTNSMLYTLIVIAGMSLFFYLATRRMKLVPTRMQNIAETLVEFLLGVTEGTAGRRVGRRIFPLIATLFLFILTANYAGLLPGVGTIGFCAEHHAVAASPAPGEGVGQTPDVDHSDDGTAEASGGLPAVDCKALTGQGDEFIPFLRAPNADLNTTLAMALLAVGIVQVAGVAAHGFGGYVKELTTPIFLAPIHIIGEISRVISLSFRLFGNVFGGEVLVTVMYALLGSVFFGFGAFIFLGLEMLFGLIQALIFSILTLVYIATAVAGHGDSHGADAHSTHAEPASEAEAMGHKVAEKLTGNRH